MENIVLVKFRACGQLYQYRAQSIICAAGDMLIVESDQGLALAEVVSLGTEVPEGTVLANQPNEPLKNAVRIALPEDLQKVHANAEIVDRATAFFKDKIRNRDLDMKLVDVEVFFDASKIIFYFTAPDRIDFRELVKDLVREFRTRIELRQIGVRHETQMLGAIGNCGMVCCCRRYLRKFAPVTIRMAKEQNLFLNPTKISGICGRLLCCLSYEQDNYDAFHRTCPRLGKRYNTSKGFMRVLRANMFRNSLTVLSESGEELEFTLDEWVELTPSRQESPVAPKTARAENEKHSMNELLVVSANPDTLEELDNMPYEDDVNSSSKK